MAQLNYLEGQRMKHLMTISVVAAMLLTGCGEDAKKAATEAANKATESVKEAATNAVEATKEAAKGAVEATEEVATEVANKTIESAKKLASNVAESAKEGAKELVDKAAEKASEAASAAKEGAAKAVDGAKEVASNAVEATKEAATSAVAAVTGGGADVQKGKTLYAKCAGCHGADGKTKALGKSAPINGKSTDEILAMLKEYKTGTRNVVGMGMLMKGQVASLSDEDLQALAAYIATLK